MLIPTRDLWNTIKPQGISFCLGYWPETNPRFFKYSWQIWTPDCKLEGEKFLQKGPKLCTADFAARIEEMEKAGMPGWIYSTKVPRMGPETPFDKNHPRWSGIKFAPSWDDDKDPIWNGHK